MSPQTPRPPQTPQSDDEAKLAFRVGSHSFRSRLIIGTGKYESFEQQPMFFMAAD